MRRTALALLGLFVALPLAAQTADEIIARYVKAIGGIEKLQSIQTLRQSGKYVGDGGFQATIVSENKRPNKVREDFTIQGMTGVTAYDGRTGWKIEPWEGKKDAEALGEDELKVIVEDADIDGPLVNYAAKGNKVEYLGTEPVEGTDAYKLKVTLANGDVRTFFFDTDYYVPIRIDAKRFVRGAERESETTLGDYKAVDGVYFPFSSESGPKGGTHRAKITWNRIEVNVPVADSRFTKPGAAGETPQQRQGQPVDASQTQPKQPAEKNPPVPPPPPAKPPQTPEAR